MPAKWHCWLTNNTTQHNPQPPPYQNRPEAGSEPRVPSRIHSTQIPWVQGCFYKADSAFLDPVTCQTGSYLQSQQVTCHVTHQYFDEHLKRQLVAVCLSMQGQGCLGYASRQTHVYLEQCSAKQQATPYNAQQHGPGPSLPSLKHCVSGLKSDCILISKRYPELQSTSKLLVWEMCAKSLSSFQSQNVYFNSEMSSLFWKSKLRNARGQ